jgi:transposase
MQTLEIKNQEAIKLKIQEYLKTSHEAKYVHRLHVILLKIDRKEAACDSIAKLFGNSGRTISNWINNVNKTGDIEVLRDSTKPGRKNRLDDSQLAIIKDVLQKDPQESTITANIWDGKSLAHYIKKTFNIELGVRQCQRLFKKLGFSLLRARPVVAKGNSLKKEASKKNFKK